MPEADLKDERTYFSKELENLHKGAAIIKTVVVLASAIDTVIKSFKM